MTVEPITNAVCGRCAATLADADALQRHEAWHDQQNAPKPQTYTTPSGYTYEVRGEQLVRVGAPPAEPLPPDLRAFVDAPAWSIAMDAHGHPIVDDHGSLITRPAS